MPNLDHLSYSSISSYLLCPESWRRHYILREKTPTATSLFLGSAVHNTIEAYVRNLGSDLPSIWQEQYAEQLQFEGVDDIDWGTDTPEGLAEDGARILRAPKVAKLLDEIKANYDPTRESSIERRVELRVPGVSVPVIGYVDIITKDGVPGDFKTAACMWSNDKATGDLQPLVYLAALNQAGEHDHNWRFRFYVITKSSKPDARVFETQRSATEVLTNLFPTVQQVWQDIQADRFPKATNSWKCNPKWCSYYAACQGS